jgi:hypothetical protein
VNQERAIEAERLLSESLDGPSGLLVKLHRAAGFDEDQFRRAIDALQVLNEEYHDQRLVPKSLAALFVDISRAMEADWKYYDSDTRARIEDARDTVVALALELMGG